jgi:hypothetical protein
MPLSGEHGFRALQAAAFLFLGGRATASNERQTGFLEHEGQMHQ